MAQRLGAPLADRGDRPIRLTPQQRRALKARAADLEAATEILRALLRDYDGPTTAPAKAKRAPAVAPPRPDPVELAGRGQEAYHAVTMLDVDDQVRRSAVRAVKSAAATLGIDPPEVLWVAGRGERGWIEAELAGHAPIAGPAARDGFFLLRHPSRVHLRAALPSPEHAAIVACHETVHVWQCKSGIAFERASGEERERLEEQANELVNRMMTQLDDNGGF